MVAAALSGCAPPLSRATMVCVPVTPAGQMKVSPLNCSPLGMVNDPSGIHDALSMYTLTFRGAKTVPRRVKGRVSTTVVWTSLETRS